MEQRIRRCPYRNNGCERKDINDFVLRFMCEGSYYFKCYEHQRVQEDKDLSVKDWFDCFV